MPIRLGFEVKNNTFLANVNSVKKRVEDGMLKGMHKGADELRDYIKDDLLSGSIVQKRTSQLRNSLYVKRSAKKLQILFRGTHRNTASGENDIPNSVLAKILEEGLNKTWWQPKRNRWHRGIKPHYFMRKGLQQKRERILQLVKQNVYAELRQPKQG